MAKIFIIEDHEKLVERLKHSLKKYGHQVENLSDFKNVEQEINLAQPDLIILDINLPYYDGFYICRMIRRKSEVPIIILSARNKDLEQLMGLEMGADDYITKPFNMDLLLAKVKTILRRTYRLETYHESSQIKVKGLRLEIEKLQLSYAGKTLELAKKEYQLLKKFMETSDTVISREQLLEILWDDATFVDDNTLTVNVSRLKNRLKELGIDGVIKTKRGIGYIFNTEVLEEDQK